MQPVCTLHKSATQYHIVNFTYEKYTHFLPSVQKCVYFVAHSEKSCVIQEKSDVFMIPILKNSLNFAMWKKRMSPHGQPISNTDHDRTFLKTSRI